MRRRRKGRSPTEYFVALIGLAIVAFVVAVIVSPGSCRVRVSPEMGVQPAAPRPTPTASR